jgi:hypothetical protein
MGAWADAHSMGYVDAWADAHPMGYVDALGYCVDANSATARGAPAGDRGQPCVQSGLLALAALASLRAAGCLGDALS